MPNNSLGVANSKRTQSILAQIKREHLFCQNGHNFGPWTEWKHKWEKLPRGHGKYTKRLTWWKKRTCKRCHNIDRRIAMSEAEINRIDAQIIGEQNV